MNESTNNPLEFLYEKGDAVFFRDPILDKTLDVPKHHSAYMKDELRNFEVRDGGEYTFGYFEEMDSDCFCARVDNKVLLIGIDEDGRINETYIYRIVSNQ